MGLTDPHGSDFAPDEIAGAGVIGGIALGGLMSLIIWAGVIGVFVL